MTKEAPSRGMATLLYLLLVVPSLYALAAIVQLDLLMGHGTGMYSDYGRNAGEISLAYAFTFLYALWFILCTIAAIRVFTGLWALRWLGLLAAVSLFVMLPVEIVFLLGVGHS
jgi:hypothetical protein